MLPQSQGVTDAKSLRTPDRAVAAGTGWWVAASGIVALVVLLTIARSIGGQRTSPTNGPDINNPAATVAVGGYTTPPWPAPADATAAVNAAGLPMLGREGNVEHIHAHLDVLVDGQAVPVPADIGIDVHRRTISPLHTHDGSGVLHIESPVKRQFSLGEFFSEWQVSLSEDNSAHCELAAAKSSVSSSTAHSGTETRGRSCSAHTMKSPCSTTNRSLAKPFLGITTSAAVCDVSCSFPHRLCASRFR